jgi:adenylate kinase family enzyme
MPGATGGTGRARGAARRVVVVGASGSGKTTFSAALAGLLGVPCVELDALFWGPRWTPVPRDTLRARVDAATAGPAWVVDGNYSVLREFTWGRADTLVWLDYPLPVVVARLVRRTLTRMWRGEELWGTGNRETWRNVFFARDSLLRLAVGQHRRQRVSYPVLLEGEFAYLRWYRFRSPAGAATWLQTVRPASAPATA